MYIYASKYFNVCLVLEKRQLAAGKKHFNTTTTTVLHW